MKPIPGFNGYMVDEAGRITNQSRVVPQFDPDGHGYLSVKIKKTSGKPVTRRVNRLVAFAFHGPPPTKDHHAAHNNGDKKDNRPGNIRWATPQENIDDKWDHGTMLVGESHPTRKLSLHQVKRIRSLYSEHMQERKKAGFVRNRRGYVTALADSHHVAAKTILDVVRGRTWSDPGYLNSVGQRISMRERVRLATIRYRRRRKNRRMRRSRG